MPPSPTSRTSPVVGAVYHPSALVHDPGEGHPERRHRVLAIRARLEETGLAEQLDWREADPAPPELVQLVHDPELLRQLDQVERSGGGWVDYPNTRVSAGSLEAALRGSQAAVDATARVLAGAWDAAVTIMRPPGHHATRNQPLGFCLTNHVAVAARWAITEGGVSRVFVLDWDVHHGNGTQDEFWTDPAVLYASLHQYPLYPGSGWVAETGEGPGAGLTINVPLPAGTGEDVYARVLDRVILPAAERFEPDLVLVSAGFDAHVREPNAEMRLLAGAYHRFAERVRGLGPGPVCVLEGGYDLDGLSWSMAATVAALLGHEHPTVVPDGERGSLPSRPGSEEWADLAEQVHARR